MNSAIYTGWVRHRRRRPVGNTFRYRAFLVYLDLAELDTVFRGRWLWSASRPAPAWFRRADHLGDPAVPLDEAVRDLVHARTGERPDGPVRLLTNLRYWGYGMNPVSFFYCFAADGATLRAIVAEVHNTPWNERHCYVLPVSASLRSAGGKGLRYAFPKAFHVSPFMPMDVDYDWRFAAPGRRVFVHMENVARGDRFFDATLVMERREITGRSLAAVLAAHPFMTGKVIAAIYGQALKLWLKRCPHFPHPGRSPRVAGLTTGGRS